LASPTFTGTVTFPDSSTVTSSGFNKLKALSVGTYTLGSSPNLAIIGDNANSNTNLEINNNNAGGSAASTLYLNNSTHYGALQFTGTGNGETFSLSSNSPTNVLHFILGGIDVGQIGFTAPNYGSLNISNVATVTTSGYYLNMPPSAAWTINQSANTAQVLNGGSYALASASGLIVITDTSINGESGIYICGGGLCSIVQNSHGNTATGIFVGSTTTPAAGHASIASNGSVYAIYNNEGGTVNYGIVLLETRNSQ
jgi:hypothetical protein